MNQILKGFLFENERTESSEACKWDAIYIGENRIQKRRKMKQRQIIVKLVDKDGQKKNKKKEKKSNKHENK